MNEDGEELGELKCVSEGKVNGELVVSSQEISANDWCGLLIFSNAPFLDHRKLQFRNNEPRHEKTGVLHMRKQRRRSASR